MLETLSKSSFSNKGLIFYKKRSRISKTGRKDKRFVVMLPQRETIGDTYARFLEENGISLVNGVYVPTRKLVDALKEGGETRSRRRIGEILRYCYTHSPLLDVNMRKREGTWTQNTFGRLYYPSRIPEHFSPRELVLRVRKDYRWFDDLPFELRGCLCEYIDSPPKNTRGAPSRSDPYIAIMGGIEVDPKSRDFINSLLSYVHRDEIPFKLFGFNIGHGSEVREQLDTLWDLNPPDIPDEWSIGELDIF